MTTHREVMQQALEALESEHSDIQLRAAIALRTALSEPEQKPAAWMYDFPNPDDRSEVIKDWTTLDEAEIARAGGVNVRPLYLHPASQPVELTRDQIREVFLAHGFTVKEGQTDLKPYVYEAAEALLAKVQPVVLTDEEIWTWWSSENGLEDCEMCKLNDFTTVVRAVENMLREKQEGKL